MDSKFWKVYWNLKHKAEIGCEGRGRLPTEGKNTDNVHEHGDIVYNVLQDWVVKGIAAGPLQRQELVDVFGVHFTVNPMTT